MKISSVLLFVTLLALVTAVSAQSKKTIRDKKISTRTVDEYFIEEGYDEPVVESIEKFNEDGELLEIQVFNKSGEIKQWEKYVYDEDGKLVEEVFLDAKGRVERTEKTVYKDGLRVEKQFFNQKGKLYKKKVYRYEYRQ